MSTNSRAAFTLVELLVALIVSSILVAATASVYSLFRKSMAAAQTQADISQNGRIVVDRLSRELRQTPEVVTDLPTDPSDTSVPQPASIEFQNGHTSDLAYYRYYLSGTTLELETAQYAFASDPATRVPDTATDADGNAPVRSVISTVAIAEHVQSLAFYGNGATIRFDLTTGDGATQSYPLETVIDRRN